MSSWIDSYTHANPSGESGEPVEPTERSRERSRPSEARMPAFWQFAMKAADVPKHVTPASAARSQSTPRSGVPGLPS